MSSVPQVSRSTRTGGDRAARTQSVQGGRSVCGAQHAQPDANVPVRLPTRSGKPGGTYFTCQPDGDGLIIDASETIVGPGAPPDIARNVNDAVAPVGVVAERR